MQDVVQPGFLVVSFPGEHLSCVVDVGEVPEEFAFGVHGLAALDVYLILSIPSCF